MCQMTHLQSHWEVTHCTQTVPCTCSVDHANPLLLMTQQMVSAFVPSWFSAWLHTEPAACCSYPAPSAVALLWHYSLQCQNFTLIHGSFQLPGGLLITILKMYSDTKVKIFHEFFFHVCQTLVASRPPSPAVVLSTGTRFQVRYSKWGTHNHFNSLQANSFRMTKYSNLIHPLIEHKRSGYPRGLVSCYKIHSPSIKSYRLAKLDENWIFKLFLNSLPLKEPN